jgi:hypothetical protein
VQMSDGLQLRAELRRRIAETCAEIELDPESRDAFGHPMCTPKVPRLPYVPSSSGSRSEIC